MKALLSDVRFLFFALAFIIYALLGAPTADHPGWIEATIACLLLSALGVGVFGKSFQLSFFEKKPHWFLSLQFLMIFGLSIPLVLAVLNGSEIFNIVRDMIGFLFLIIPLFLIPLCEKEVRTQKTSMALFYLCLIIGLSFSLRTLFPDSLLNRRGDELLYLANSPLVLFAAIFFMGYSGQKLFESVTLKNICIFCLSLLAGVVCLWAMMEDIRRASFFAVIVSLIVIAIIGFIKAPVRMILPAILLLALIFLFHQQIFDMVDQIILKTSRVGMNMRLQEWETVWQVIQADWISIFFGKGWGASFASPAVGGYQVTFTHSLLSAMLLKTGIIGLLLCVAYLFFVFEKLMDVVFSNPVAGMALFWAFIIPVLFYASYKSLDFGLLLTLILILAKPAQERNFSINE